MQNASQTSGCINDNNNKLLIIARERNGFFLTKQVRYFIELIDANSKVHYKLEHWSLD